MKLTALAAAAQEVVQANHSVLIYGPPKVGKTKLVGTAAKIVEIENIYWFDLENGVETLLHMGLTPEEMNKVTVFKIPDTRDNPVGMETLLKALTSKTGVDICEAHGKVKCQVCAKDKLPTVFFKLSDCTNRDLVVIDSGSQAGDSAMAIAMLGKDDLIKPTWDEYAHQGKLLGDALSVIQAARYTNFVVITHEIPLEDESGKDRIYPLMGTRQFSMKVAKYFGTVVYVHKKMNKHVAGSSSLYRGDLLTGSRVNAAIEKNGEPDMKTILIEGGIIKSGPANNTSPTAPVTEQAPAVENKATSIPAANPLNRLLAKKQNAA